MVGPVGRDDRSSLVRRLKIGFVVVIGASAGLIAIHGDAEALEVGAVTAVGLLFGVLVVWFVFPGDGEVASNRRRRR